ncbi:MAG TPA: hypothetical protein VG963_27105 [Polyangiaceae bacterium]|nr:hypothetical protein [Polyangiaceae bacterium]
MWPKYRSFDEFERDEIRPGLRMGWSLDNINDPTAMDLDFDEDPFERALLETENDTDDDSDVASDAGLESGDRALR